MELALQRQRRLVHDGGLHRYDLGQVRPRRSMTALGTCVLSCPQSASYTGLLSDMPPCARRCRKATLSPHRRIRGSSSLGLFPGQAERTPRLDGRGVRCTAYKVTSGRGIRPVPRLEQGAHAIRLAAPDDLTTLARMGERSGQSQRSQLSITRPGPERWAGTHYTAMTLSRTWSAGSPRPPTRNQRFVLVKRLADNLKVIISTEQQNVGSIGGLSAPSWVAEDGHFVLPADPA
jgi:hypothetical protein